MKPTPSAGRWPWLLLALLLVPVATHASDPQIAANRIVVYYFHTTYRCASCQKIEAYTHEAVATSFAADIEKGRVVWKLVNTDEKPNAHFVKDYKLYTKSVVLSEEINGEQQRWKNLPRVWELLGDKPGFLLYIQEETAAYLTELP
ncbi:MAG TPA: nitrophenyl compound nitroreductase subunit ArsF family protein [Candidatus Krumholzibacteria bacterium]|nr:nitrophenyl compound nitroreductase subunit ArsF family protein [Candidatus Krumholzibacteria bacterium]